MAFDFITAGLDLIKTGLVKWIPDANLREQAAMDVATQLNAQIMGQIELNKVEASSQRLFVAGWRPAIGWVCVGAYAYTFVGQPLLVFFLTTLGIHLDIAQLPRLEMGELSAVLFAMLGMGGMRTYEKVKGVPNPH